MKTEDISKLPPAIKLVADDLRHAGCLGEDDSYRLLAYCLQMQEERDAAIAMHEKEESTPCECCATIATLKQEAADDALHNKFRDEVFDKQEATIATLTRELENSRINHIDANQRNITAEAEVTRLREHMSACENCAALSHTPEGKI